MKWRNRGAGQREAADGHGPQGAARSVKSREESITADRPRRSTPPCAAFDGELFRVCATPHVPVALEYVRRSSPSIIVTELAFDDGSGVDVCSAAKSMRVPATVLITTADPAAVPDALAAGCDGVLLKPFAPNLLVARVSRLLRDRSNQIRLQAARSLGKSCHLSERIDLLKTGTNRKWPNTHCPYCNHPGVTSFDFASMRRAWYACLECRKAWLAKRQE